MENIIYEYSGHKGGDGIDGEIRITNKKIETHDSFYTIKSINGVFYKVGVRHKIVHFIFFSIFIFFTINMDDYFSNYAEYGVATIFWFSFWVAVFPVNKNYHIYINDFGKKKKIYIGTHEPMAKKIVKSIEEALSK